MGSGAYVELAGELADELADELAGELAGDDMVAEIKKDVKT